MTLYLKAFISRVKNYTFKRVVDVKNNKYNFNNNLKNYLR